MTVGVTAGASAPEILVEQVTNCLKELGMTITTDDRGITEDVTFVLPKELRKMRSLAEN